MAFELEPPQNDGYAAHLIRVERLLPAQNADRLQIIPVMGMQALVGLDVQVGDVGIIIPAMTQLSHEMCYYNNLYTHPEDNYETGAPRGYIENHRRLKAIKLRGNRSDAIFLRLNSLAWAFKNRKDFAKFLEEMNRAAEAGEQVSFDKIGEVEICRKWIKPVKGNPALKENVRQKVLNELVEERLFPEHYNSPHFGMVSDQLDPGTRVVVTQKLHGTSVRIGYVPTVRKLSRLESFAKRWLKWPIAEHTYGMVYGSHHGIKGADAGSQRDFYDHDVWSEEGRKLAGVVPKNWILYGEIVGFTPSHAHIQSNYTYDCLPGERKLYIYRIAVVNEDGIAVDLSWEAIKQWCTNNGLLHVPELEETKVGNFDFDDYADMKFTEQLGKTIPVWAEPVRLSEGSPCDEGVCIRIEGLTPYIIKAKSPEFVQHESALKDAGAPDMEEDGVETTPCDECQMHGRCLEKGNGCAWQEEWSREPTTV